MTNTTRLSLRIDKEIKQNAENTLNDMGLTMSAAITIFLKKLEENIEFLSRYLLIYFIVKKIWQSYQKE